MSKQSKRRHRAKMIRAAEQSHNVIQFEASSVDWIKASENEGEAKPKRFSMVAYTGGLLRLGYYSDPVVVDLTGLRAKAPVPILMDHNAGKIVGHADEVDIGASLLKLSGIVSGASDEASQVSASATMGFPWKASIGARPDKMEFIGENTTVTVNGKIFKGPLLVARKATLGEVSFVAIAADNKTTVKVAASAANRKEENMEFQDWIKAIGFDPESLTDAQTAKLQAKFDAEVKVIEAKAADEKNKKIEGSGKPPAVDVPKFDLPAIVLAYEKHITAVQAKATDYGGKIEAAKLHEIQATAGKKAIELKSQALNDEKSAAWLEVELIKAQADAKVELIKAERPKGPAIHGSTRDNDMTPRVIEAALCRSIGLPDMEKHFDEKTLEASDARECRGFGLQTLLLQAAAANGYRLQIGERIHAGNAREVLSHALPNAPIRASGFSTLDVSGILSSTANKVLLSGFNAVPQTWREVAAIRTVSDFKSVTAYRMTADLEYEELPPSGEITHGTLGEESYSIQAKTYAKMLTLTRTDIINDDLGAFNDLRNRLGMGAVLKMNKVFWTPWINNSAVFTAARGNYQEGAATALGEAGLNTAVQLFRDMTGPDGNALGLSPVKLIVPTALEATAKKWHVSTEVRDTTASTKTAIANIYQGSFKPVPIPELGNSNYTGYSALAWYLLADPAILATAAMCFLNGQQSPTIESADADFNTLGIQLRGYHDFGVAMSEWRAGVKSKGEN